MKIQGTRTQIPDLPWDLVESRLSQPHDAGLAPRGFPRGLGRREGFPRLPRPCPVLVGDHRLEPIFPRVGEFRSLRRSTRREGSLPGGHLRRVAAAAARARHQHDRRAATLGLHLRRQRHVRLEHLPFRQELLVLLEHAGDVEEAVHEVTRGRDGSIVHGDLVPVLPVLHLHDAKRIVAAGRHRAVLSCAA